MNHRVPLLPFHIGNDICRIPRIYRILASGRGPQFIRRVLTSKEQQQPRCKRILEPVLRRSSASSSPFGQRVPNGAEEQGESSGILDLLPPRDIRNPGESDKAIWKAAEFMAGRFAAKEAAIKAHPHRSLTFQSISIMRYASEATPESDAPPDHQQQQQQRRGNRRPSEAQPARDRPLRNPEDLRSSGPPVALIEGDDRYEDCYASISISHDGQYATAVCLGVSPYAGQAGNGCLKRV
ncbi:hypothetical protein DL762_001374 [Monosporascus cannonballus]|uniref:4'-phosphopantetheinyl transferase domain-containing protein n=1 Tax=Monosporascus cannonballus TaxID=155416 RepID=A0ABY0HIT7_9PEZI|nr:hypothetical protein DL762_001374 [Monosporascus cannonballus]